MADFCVLVHINRPFDVKIGHNNFFFLNLIPATNVEWSILNLLLCVTNMLPGRKKSLVLLINTNVCWLVGWRSGTVVGFDGVLSFFFLFFFLFFFSFSFLFLFLFGGWGWG